MVGGNLNTVLYYMNLLLTGAAVFMGLLRWRKAGAAMRMFVALLVVSFLGELVALWWAVRHGNNNAVYNLFDIMQFIILCLYFNESIMSFRRYGIGIWLAVFSVVFWSITSFPSVNADLDTGFLLYEGLITLGMCALLQIQLYRADGPAKVTSFAHFWLSGALMFYWACNLLNWQLFQYYGNEDNYFILLMPLVSNIVAFAIFGIVFFKLPKLQTSP